MLFRSLSEEVYRDIMRHVAAKNVMVVLDAAQKSLLNDLPCHPFLIKPNMKELSDCLGQSFETVEDVIKGTEKLRHLGARNVLVSLAAKGAVLVTENGESFYKEAPHGQVINSVGAGDSMVAGFIKGFLNHHDYCEALAMGIACGSASAFSEWLPQKEDIESIYTSLSPR